MKKLNYKWIYGLIALLVVAGNSLIVYAATNTSKPIKDIFPDPVIAKLVATDLSMTVEDIVSDEDLLEVELLSPGEEKVTSLQGIDRLENLKVLYLDDQKIDDLSLISSLTKLEDLSLERVGLSDVSLIAKLTSLEELYLGDNEMNDISALAKLTNLKTLSLFGNEISDVRTLASLKDLQTLNLAQTAIDNDGIRSSQINGYFLCKRKQSHESILFSV